MIFIFHQNQILFNRNVISCLNLSDGQELNQLDLLLHKVMDSLDTLAGSMSTNLLPWKRLTLNSLITLSVHNRDVVKDLIIKNVTKKEDFEWTRWVLV